MLDKARALVRRVFRARQTSPDRFSIFNIPFFSRNTTAGVRVDEGRAMTYAAVYDAVRIISETIGILGWHVFRRRADGGRDLVINDVVENLIHTRPSPEMSSMTFRETLTAHALTWGNGFAEIVRDLADRAVAMFVLLPNRVTIERDTAGQIVYRHVNGNGQSTVLAQRDVFHLRGMGFDGISGYPVIQLARESIGLGLGTEAFGSAFFGNGAHYSGVYSFDNMLTDETRKKVRDALNEHKKGPGAKLGTLVIEGGGKWQSIGIPPEDAQFLETRKFQITEIARWFRLPPHKLAEITGVPRANIEQSAIEFVTDAIHPWVKRWEEEADWKLLGKSNGQLIARMNMDTLLRGDAKSRNEAFEILHRNGLVTGNEIRTFLGMNRMPDGQGDIFVLQLNQTTREQLIKSAEQPTEPAVSAESADGEATAEEAGPATVVRTKRSFARVFSDAGERLVRKEVKAATRAKEKFATDRPGFLRWVDRFYGEYRADIVSQVAGSLLAMGELLCPSGAMDQATQEVAAAYADAVVARSRADLLTAFDEGGYSELLEEWQNAKPSRMAVELTEKAVTLSALSCVAV